MLGPSKYRLLSRAPAPAAMPSPSTQRFYPAENSHKRCNWTGISVCVRSTIRRGKSRTALSSCTPNLNSRHLMVALSTWIKKGTNIIIAHFREKVRNPLIKLDKRQIITNRLLWVMCQWIALIISTYQNSRKTIQMSCCRSLGVTKRNFSKVSHAVLVTTLKNKYGRNWNWKTCNYCKKE